MQKVKSDKNPKFNTRVKGKLVIYQYRTQKSYDKKIID